MAVNQQDISYLENYAGYNLKDMGKIKKSIEDYIEVNTLKIKELSLNIPTKEDNLKLTKAVGNVLTQNKLFLSLQEKIMKRMENDTLTKRMDSVVDRQQKSLNTMSSHLQKSFNENVKKLNKRLSATESQLKKIAEKTIDEINDNNKTESEDRTKDSDKLKLDMHKNVQTAFKKYNSEITSMLKEFNKTLKKQDTERGNITKQLISEADSTVGKIKELVKYQESEFSIIDKRFSNIETRLNDYIEDKNEPKQIKTIGKKKEPQTTKKTSKVHKIEVYINQKDFELTKPVEKPKKKTEFSPQEFIVGQMFKYIEGKFKKKEVKPKELKKEPTTINVVDETTKKEQVTNPSKLPESVPPETKILPIPQDILNIEESITEPIEKKYEKPTTDINVFKTLEKVTKSFEQHLDKIKTEDTPQQETPEIKPESKVVENKEKPPVTTPAHVKKPTFNPTTPTVKDESEVKDKGVIERFKEQFTEYSEKYTQRNKDKKPKPEIKKEEIQSPSLPTVNTDGLNKTILNDSQKLIKTTDQVEQTISEMNELKGIIDGDQTKFKDRLESETNSLLKGISENVNSLTDSVNKDSKEPKMTLVGEPQKPTEKQIYQPKMLIEPSQQPLIDATPDYQKLIKTNSQSRDLFFKNNTSRIDQIKGLFKNINIVVNHKEESTATPKIPTDINIGIGNNINLVDMGSQVVGGVEGASKSEGASGLILGTLGKALRRI